MDAKKLRVGLHRVLNICKVLSGSTRINSKLKVFCHMLYVKTMLNLTCRSRNNSTRSDVISVKKNTRNRFTNTVR